MSDNEQPKVKIHPVRWNPPQDIGLTGEFAVTRVAPEGEYFATPGIGPEDVLVLGNDTPPTLVTGLEDGRVVSTSNRGASWRTLADTGGRPLGIELAPDGGLIVCDAHVGLIWLHPDGSGYLPEVLVSRASAADARLVNNAAVASDGTIYFSDSSSEVPVEQFKADLLAGEGTGRLLRRSPDGSVDVLASGLRFANGVALNGDESAVTVAETGGYCVRRVALSGPNAGAITTVVDNLPGIPDNMASGPGGLVWIALASDRNKLLDSLLPKPGWIRQAVWAMPDALQPDATRVVLVMAIDPDAASDPVRAVVHSTSIDYHFVTGVRVHGDDLYVGSLVEDRLARLPGAAVVHPKA